MIKAHSRKADRTSIVLPVSGPAFPVDYESEKDPDEAARFLYIDGNAAYYLHSSELH